MPIQPPWIRKSKVSHFCLPCQAPSQTRLGGGAQRRCFIKQVEDRGEKGRRQRDGKKFWSGPTESTKDMEHLGERRGQSSCPLPSGPWVYTSASPSCLLPASRSGFTQWAGHPGSRWKALHQLSIFPRETSRMLRSLNIS